MGCGQSSKEGKPAEKSRCFCKRKHSVVADEIQEEVPEVKLTSPVEVHVDPPKSDEKESSKVLHPEGWEWWYQDPQTYQGVLQLSASSSSIPPRVLRDVWREGDKVSQTTSRLDDDSCQTTFRDIVQSLDGIAKPLVGTKQLWTWWEERATTFDAYAFEVPQDECTNGSIHSSLERAADDPPTILAENVPLEVSDSFVLLGQLDQDVVDQHQAVDDKQDAEDTLGGADEVVSGLIEVLLEGVNNGINETIRPEEGPLPDSNVVSMIDIRQRLQEDLSEDVLLDLLSKLRDTSNFLEVDDLSSEAIVNEGSMLQLPKLNTVNHPSLSASLKLPELRSSVTRRLDRSIEVDTNATRNRVLSDWPSMSALNTQCRTVEKPVRTTCNEEPYSCSAGPLPPARGGGCGSISGLSRVPSAEEEPDELLMATSEQEVHIAASTSPEADMEADLATLQKQLNERLCDLTGLVACLANQQEPPSIPANDLPGECVLTTSPAPKNHGAATHEEASSLENGTLVQTRPLESAELVPDTRLNARTLQVSVLECDGMPEAALLSLKLGEVRRQASISSLLPGTSTPLRLPIPRFMHLDAQLMMGVTVLHPLASATIVLHPACSNYVVSLPSEVSPSSLLSFRVSRSTRRPSIDSSITKLFDCNGVEEYLERHKLLQYIPALLQATVRERSSEPFAFMANQVSACDFVSDRKDVCDASSSSYIELTRAEGFPEGSLLSVRSGSDRRQAPITVLLKDKTRLKVAPNVSSIKVQVLQPAASSKMPLSLDHQQVHKLRMKGTDGSMITMSLSVDLHGQQVDSCNQSVVPSEQGHSQKESQEEYITRHDLLHYVRCLMQELAKEQPSDPLGFLYERFQEGNM